MGKLEFLGIGGELSALMRERDWASSPVGLPERWPQSLRTTLSLMLDNGHCMFVAWGPELTFFYNDAYAAFLGARHPAALGRPFPEVWTELWPDLAPLVDRTLAGEMVWQDERHLVMTRNGYPEDTWFSFSYSPVRDDKGQVNGMIGVVNDMTAKVVAERRSKAERDLLATVFDGTDMLILVSDLDYNILAINPANVVAFRQVYGVRPTVGDNMLDLLADQPECQAEVREGWARGLSGEEVTFVQEFGNPGLARTWFEVTFRPLLDAAGQRVGAYQFVSDITERKRSEAALAEAQDQLRQSQKLEAIGQLTGGVAHDFNNLLTVIRGSVDLLRHDNLPDDKRTRYIDAIGNTADRAAKLTGQLLAFARRQALTSEMFDAGISLEEVATMIGTMTGSRITLDIHLPQEPFFIVADRSQFDTAIVNMGINARDAMGGEGRLTIATGPVSGIPAIRGHAAVAGDFIAVTITDMGSGIAPGEIDRIFEPFFTTKGVGQGTGLGLSQVIGFAKQSGGDIRVDSKPGEGTTFTLYLPRAYPDGNGQQAEQADEDSDGSGVCVLVVEDNAEVGEFATSALKELGYDTVLANDGHAALRLLDENCRRFHVVFSDVVMPGMDGIELGSEVRERYPDVPVILTSGYSHVLAQNGQHGFELLHKPYSVDQLSRVLRKAVIWQIKRRGLTEGVPNLVDR
ncbi:PAS domain-containing protein [Sphingomonas sp. PsM26]|nr:PAS domain-containing protein [Sphingomonas sp. PsM26]